MNFYSFGEFEKEGREGESVVTCSEACPVLVALLKILYRDNKICLNILELLFLLQNNKLPRNTALVYSKILVQNEKKVL